jgi:hypothetical protein
MNIFFNFTTLIMLVGLFINAEREKHPITRIRNTKHPTAPPTTDDNPTIITNYIGRWFPMYAENGMYVFSGYGSSINTEDDNLSSKKLERMVAYAYRDPTNNITDYGAYFESVPLDGSYWYVTLNNLTTIGYIKYTIVYDYTGAIWIWGQTTMDTSINPPVCTYPHNYANV